MDDETETQAGDVPEIPVMIITPEQLAEIAALERGEDPGQLIIERPANDRERQARELNRTN
jgi:hypothetical protein